MTIASEKLKLSLPKYNVPNGGFGGGHVLQVMYALAIMWWFLMIGTSSINKFAGLPPTGF